MNDDTITVEVTAEDIAEREASWHHHAARASAYEDAAQFVLARAMTAFARGADKDAELIREIASHLTAFSIEERKKQHENE